MSSSGAVPPLPLHTPSTRGLFPRVWHILGSRPTAALLQLEHRVYEYFAEFALVALRIAVGAVFLWFGFLKLLPLSIPIDTLAESILLSMTRHHVAPVTLLHILGVWECCIGLGLLFGRFLRVATGLLFLQMPGTLLPLVMLRHETWYHAPWLPTFEGQYIIKNLVLISAGMVIAVASRGGKLITNPRVAERAKRLEIALHEREISSVEREIEGEPK